MATWERPRDLFERQIASIREQTHQEWVCLISDDSSSYRSLEMINDVVGDDPRFFVSSSPERLGFYRNFERALGMVPTGHASSRSAIRTTAGIRRS